MTTVLVVDDDPVTLRFMLATLRNAGIDAVGMGDAMSGVHTVRLLRPDLILMDLNLPGVNGATATDPSGPAMTVRAPFRTTTCRHVSAASEAAEAGASPQKRSIAPRA